MYNKHLLPVGGIPMICWPLRTLHENGIIDITIVSTPRGIGQIAEYLGSGYNYRVQENPGGIPQAIACAEQHGSHEYIAVILGDNIFLPAPNISEPLVAMSQAAVFLKRIEGDRKLLSQYGVPIMHTLEGGGIERVVEKPENPPSDLAVTGLYIFSHDVFNKIKTLKPSERGETEVADLLNLYADKHTLGYKVVEGFWGDAGTPQGLARCEIASRTDWKK